ncbi:MAG: type II secretion system protein GspD [Phycisphaerae bacterium]
MAVTDRIHTILLCAQRRKRTDAHSLHATAWNRALFVTLTILLFPTFTPAQNAQPAVDSDAPAPQTEQLTPGESGLLINQNRIVEFHCDRWPLEKVLQSLALQGRISIIASPQVEGTVSVSLYDKTVDDALKAILTTLDAGFIRQDGFYYVYTNEELKTLAEPEEEPLETEVFQLSYLNAADAASFIEPMLEEGETVTASPVPAQGIANEPSEAGGYNHAAEDVVVVNAKPRKMEEVRTLLKKIDRRPRQVLVEATILRAQLSDESGLGIDFTMVAGVDLELIGATSTGVQDLTLGQLPTDRFENFNANISTDFRDQVPAGGVTLGIIKDNVGIFLRALEQVTDTTVLANPKILALNKQKGQVIVGRRDGYLTTTVTETQTVQTVEFLVTGTQLIFRPFIGEDDYVRMELHPEDSVGFVSAQGLPSEQTTEVTTNVIVKDGQTILIGGLFREVTTTTNQQIPIIGNVPVLGPLFKAQNDSTDREEVIILLTVKIIDDLDTYAETSDKVFDNIDQIRLGSRRGLMWHGRELIAQRYYEKALEKNLDGDIEKALVYLDIALYHQPRLLNAKLLRQSLTHRRDTEHEGSAARSFIFDVIADEKGYPAEVFGRDPDVRTNTLPNSTIEED